MVVHTCIVFQYWPLAPGGLLESTDSCREGRRAEAARERAREKARHGVREVGWGATKPAAAPDDQLTLSLLPHLGETPQLATGLCHAHRHSCSK